MNLRKRANQSQLFLLSLFIVASLIAACGRSKGSPSSTSAQDPNRLELIFSYGSEKEKWIKEVTEKFNQAQNKTPSRKTIFVSAIAMGSGESIDEILTEKRKPHLTSPAS